MYTIPFCNQSAYELVFEDDFNASSLDTSKWQRTCCYYGGLQGSQHVEYNSLNNVGLLNGTCVITAKKESVTRKVTDWYDSTALLEDGLPNLRNFDYTSGSIQTKKSFFHGKFEARCRMPNGKGLWPAFWMYGGVRGNEIDVFDNYEGTTKLVTNILHDYDGNQKQHQCSERFSSFDFTQWHTFACIFDFDKISFLVDDKLMRIVHRIITPSGEPVNCDDNISPGSYFFLKAYPIERMQVILNLALLSENGPAGSVAVDETSELPAIFEIDHVKIWEKKNNRIRLTVSPNPVESLVNIDSDHAIKSLRLTDVQGRTLKLFDVNATSFSFDASYLSPGMYFIRASFEEIEKTVKLIKL